ncbi:MAG: ArsR/SmtB family transcription factor [Promethearchaeota archaeon]
MSFPTLNDWLYVLGNETRWKILRLLTQEAHYPYQIAKILSISQQTIERHLNILSSKGIVSKKKVKSTKGPARHYYTLKSSVLLTASIAPNTFNFDLTPIPKEAPIRAKGLPFLLEKVTEAQSHPDIPDTIYKLLEVLQSLDHRTRSFSKKQAELLFLKQLVLREISDQISESGLEYSSRSLIWSALEHSKLILENMGKEESLEVSITYEEVSTVLTEQIQLKEELDHNLHQQDTDEDIHDLKQFQKVKGRKIKHLTSQGLLPATSDDAR